MKLLLLGLMVIAFSQSHPMQSENHREVHVIHERDVAAPDNDTVSGEDDMVSGEGADIVINVKQVIETGGCCYSGCGGGCSHDCSGSDAGDNNSNNNVTISE